MLSYLHLGIGLKPESETMKVLLISPAVLSALQVTNTIMPPLGFLYVAATLKKGGHDVDFIDMSLRQNEADFSLYDAVGITSTTPQMPEAFELAQQAKEAGKIVIMGGSHPSFMAEELLSSGYVDYVVRGEGELTALELLDALEAEGPRLEPKDILGLSWYNARTRQVVHNPARVFVSDLDWLPDPARELADMEAYKATKYGDHSITSLLTSRGCPYDCSFCASTQLNGRKWRKRTVGPIVDEIEVLVEKYGFGAIAFVDDNFTIHVPRAKELCDEILRRRLNINWWAMCSADSLVKSEELVAKMAVSGCDEIFIGLETPNQRILDSYNKRATADIGGAAVELLKKHGIGIYGAFILGEVSETEEDIETTVKYAKSLGLELVQFSLLTPYPGARLFYQLKDRLITDEWRKFDGLHSTFRLDFIAPERLERLLMKAYFSFYFDPLRVLTNLKWRDLKKAAAILKVIKKC